MIELSRINAALLQKKELSQNSIKSLVGKVISDGFVDENGILLKEIPPLGHTDNKRGFCDVAANLLYAKGFPNCYAPIVTDFGPFDTSTMNFETTRGIRYFNFTKMTNKTYYTIYADINGEKGKEKIGVDIIKYYVTLDGQVLDRKPVEKKDSEKSIIDLYVPTK